MNKPAECAGGCPMNQVCDYCQRPERAADAWQPIKTAPRDGRNILLRFGVDGVSQGKYVQGGSKHPWQFIDTNDGITWLVNHAVDGPGGPSHWQPMPGAERGTSEAADRTTPASKADVVNHPSHYTAGKVECIDALEAATTGLVGIEAVCTANAIKYLWRWKQKNGVEDLKKARWYINRLVGDA